jgi:type II secretory pathway pseudopilin PulG
MLRTNLSLIVAKNLAAFTMLEAMVGIAVLGIGAASTIGALTKFNSIAAISRNATGAYTVVMNQIDSFQSMSPFSPQKTNPDGTPQIPKDFINNPPTYDMTVGTHTIGYKDPTTGVVSNQWPVYQYKDPSTGMTVVVKGTVTIAVTDVSATTAPNTYMAVVTITYNYLNHDGIHQPNYSFSMTAIRTSDI